MIPREGTVIADRYRLERKVGGGRVSAVWRVRDEISARPCAIKILHRSMHKHPEALTRFSLEDRLARELNGPHFPERIGSGVWDGMRYIAWRWHEGESLRALFERNPKQDAPTVHSIVQETCQALALVHAAGYTHGDLKPENILFADRGDGERSRQVKLLGFGVASRLSRPSAAGFGVGRRRPGEVVGTPLYLSPDLILGRVPNGGQADLWALAVIVYEALTGRAPFLGFDIGAVLHAILERRAPRPSSIADNLPASFDTWWAQAIAQEFETPNEFAGALARALAPALRTSHTQRSASLPDRLPPALEVTPMPSPRPSAAPSEVPSAQRSGASSPAPGAQPAPAARSSTAPAAQASGGAATTGALGSSAPPASPAVAAHSSGAPAAQASPAPAAQASPAPTPQASPAPPAQLSPPPAATAHPRPVRASTSSTGTTATGLGPANIGLTRPPPPAPESEPIDLARTLVDRPIERPGDVARPAADTTRPAEPPRPSPEPRGSSEPLRSSVEPLRAAAEPGRAAAEPGRAAVEPLRASVEPLRRAAESPRPADAAPPADAARAGEPPPPPLAAAGSSTETFAPLPSPQRDLGAEATRKTLVGITPPLSLIPPTPGPAPLMPTNPARASTPDAIEGAPCKPIETGGRSPFEAALFPEGMRRPANPTVPFPRPRVLPRHTGSHSAAEGHLASPGSDETPDIGRSWHGTTTRTLRVVLTGPDHKPQRVAAALVCAAAALVIFAIGRSPVAGTAGIGQATESLTAEPAQQPQTAPVLADPGSRSEELMDRSSRSELAAASGSDAVSDVAAPPVKGRAQEPAPLEPDELAPGLVAPPSDLPGPTRPASESSPADAAAPGSAGGRPTPAVAPPSPKTSAKKTPPPPPPASLPTPARKTSTELDFGI